MDVIYRRFSVYQMKFEKKSLRSGKRFFRRISFGAASSSGLLFAVSVLQ